MKLKIWERYFLKELFSMFFLIILCFYGIYILIDFTSHSGSAYFHTHFMWKELIIFYTMEFIRRADVIVPFALLIASIRTLTTLNSNNELIALLTSGVKLKRLLRPFLCAAFLLTALLFVNAQYLLPFAHKELKHLGNKHFLKLNKKKEHPSVHHLVLEDGTKLLYHTYDEQNERFKDLFWVQSINTIYRMKSLDPNADIPTGYFVDKLERLDSDSGMHVTESYTTLPMEGLVFNKKALLETITLPEEQPLSFLFQQIPDSKEELNDKQAHSISVFYRKLSAPLLCLLAVLGTAPFCIKTSRNLSVFYIYAYSIFGLVFLYLILDAATVLGKKQVLSPEMAIGPILLLFSLPVTIRYIRATV